MERISRVHRTASSRPPHPGPIVTLLALLAAAGCSGPLAHFPSADTGTPSGSPVELSALLDKPVGPAPFPVVILLHGCSGMYGAGGALNARQSEWTKLLLREGYGVLNLDSFNPRGVRDVCPFKPQPVQAYRHRAPDARGALRWLQAQPFVKADRIAVLGWSHGGLTVLDAVDAVRYPPAKLDGRPDFRVAVSFYPECVSLVRSGWFTSVPTLLLIGKADDWTPAAPCKELAERTHTVGTAIEFVSYPGAHHGFEAPGVPVRVLTGIPTGVNGSTVTIGTDPNARADALRRVPLYLAKYLKE